MRGRRKVGGLLVAMIILVGAAPAAASADSFSFSNPAPIALDSSTSNGSPYPSDITVTGLEGYVSKVTASFSNLSYGNARLVHALLVGPGGQSVVLMANSCAGAVANLSLNFDDAASASLPASGCSSGPYKPTNPPAFNFFPPAPSPPYGAALSSFNTVAPNGTWSLYLATDTAMAPLLGSMAGGWSLQLTGPTPRPGPTPPPGLTGQRDAALKKCKKKHSRKKRKKCRKKANLLPG